jgi:cysteinyl-tRNA synthetase
LDFVLWKAAKTDEPREAQWASEFGTGRPGWHIECSAMSCEMLGESFDIHGGGADLQFPHHENEIAQSEGASGQPLARFWMHNGFVRVDNEKMSKSLGNFFTIREVLARYDPETVRYFIIRTHYRSALNYSDAHLDDARTALRRLYTCLQVVPPAPVLVDWKQGAAQRFATAMNDDFGTPEAMAVLFDLATEVNRSRDPLVSGLLKALGGVLGLLQADPQRWLQGGVSEGVLNEADIVALIERRQAAKVAKDFAQADAVRQQLLAQGVALKDGPQGTSWERL